jgi:hypothetical protein
MRRKVMPDGTPLSKPSKAARTILQAARQRSERPYEPQEEHDEENTLSAFYSHAFSSFAPLSRLAVA